MQKAQGPAIAPGNIRRIDPFGANEAGTELLHQQPKRMIRVLLHRSQGDVMSKANRADLPLGAELFGSFGREKRAVGPLVILHG